MTLLRCLTTAASASGTDPIQDEVVDAVNHELRSPLTSLLGHAELLQDLDLPEAAERSLDAIIRAGEQLLSLALTFSQIVDLERSDDGTTPPRARPIVA